MKPHHTQNAINTTLIPGCMFQQWRVILYTTIYYTCIIRWYNSSQLVMQYCNRWMIVLRFTFLSLHVRHIKLEDKCITIKRTPQRTTIVGMYNDRSNIHHSNVQRLYYEYVMGTFYWPLLYNVLEKGKYQLLKIYKKTSFADHRKYSQKEIIVLCFLK